MTDHDGDYYSVDFPSGISEGVYRVTIFKQAAGAPHADNDISIAQGEIYWDGSAERNIATLEAYILSDLIGADGDTLEDLSDQLDGLTAPGYRNTNIYPPGF